MRTNTDEQRLGGLVERYALNKSELDSYKKICDQENSEIKELMAKLGKDEYSVGELTAKISEIKKESMNEERLIQILKKHGKADGIIQTKEYVDMDALENYLYNNSPENEFLQDLSSCKIVNTVVQLRVKRNKKKKEED